MAKRSAAQVIINANLRKITSMEKKQQFNSGSATVLRTVTLKNTGTVHRILGNGTIV